MSVEEKKKELKDNMFKLVESYEENLHVYELIECVVQVSEAMIVTLPECAEDKSHTVEAAKVLLSMLEDFYGHTKKQLIDRYLDKVMKGH